MIDRQEPEMTDLATKPETDVEIDAELLEEAQRQISAPSPNAAINEALLRLVTTERARRGAAMEALRKLARDGHFNFDAADGDK
ncbi:type II toxin-antitoxin system VapB family antitoxin [Paractinoplanes toevensis]|uniref:Uncharacterized protein n=1 Tax=Paractinoplanes toevensis TaxID=571911 RepID=A0A919WDE7_9ACTN|nr:type II toxin-antitoxin system VapB family antitoxin [Actinoplanes toevensis]GIM98210.1 hypothetical protein Ato02nite_100030 [Actinoplanes toevensis]